MVAHIKMRGVGEFYSIGMMAAIEPQLQRKKNDPHAPV